MEKPRLLLHCCCAPCASAVIERLADDFRLTLLFYNPNLDTAEEYDLRARELERYSAETIGAPGIVPDFDPHPFYEAAKGLETCPEGGARCEACIGLRLRYTAAQAAGFEYFTTTLSVSPHKNAARINALGEKFEADAHGAQWLYSDFKKRDGFKRSTELSRQHNLYRQNYCGCAFSKR